MEHAHPHSENYIAPQQDYISPNGPPPRRPFRSVPNTPSPLRSPQQDEGPFSLQQRRLQLRNAGFRAPRMPSHRLSARLSRWIAAKDEPEPEPAKQDQQENTAPTRKRKHAQTTPLVPSHILQEITNSTRPRSSQKRSAIQIFEDLTDASSPEVIGSPGTTRRSMRSHSHSLPSMGSYIGDEDWPLRQLSGNDRSPMLGSRSPTDRTGRQQKRTLELRKASYEASQYIEHLETQLAATQESIMSPRTGKPIQDKVKVLSRENKRLRQMVEEWEDRFDARVKEAVEHRAMAEMDLYRRVKLLEDQLGQRDAMIRDLESINDRTQHDLSYLESLKLSIEKLEDERFALEETNRSLERRNDVLTELLAQSPTRAENGFGLSSPSRERPSWTTPRPQSMLPRLSTSPRASSVYRPLSVQASLTGTPESGYFDHHAIPGSRDSQPYIELAEGDNTIVRSPDSVVGEPHSVPSSAVNSSQRSSLISSSSGPSIGVLPLPLFSPDGQKGKSRNRRSRRFAPGSTTLKPLLLSTLNGATQSSTNSPPDVTPMKTDPLSPIRQASARSSDFASRLLANEGIFNTPTQLRHQSSEEALRALEGDNEEHFDSFDQVLAKHGIGGQRRYSPYSEPSPGLEGLRDAPGFHRRSIDQVMTEKPDSNEYTLKDNIKTEDKENCQTFTGSPSGLDSPSNRDPSLRSHRVSPLSFSYQRFPPFAPQPDIIPRQTSHAHPPLPYSTLPKPTESRTESKVPKPSSRIPRLSSAPSLSSNNYARLFRTLSNDPTAIARRVIANAWRSNWSVLGRLSWWVLGLFFPGRRTADRREHARNADLARREVYELEGSPVPCRSGEQNEMKASSPVVGEKRTWRREMFLWGKFSAAILLAVGGALVKGPGVMLGECEEEAESESEAPRVVDADRQAEDGDKVRRPEGEGAVEVEDTSPTPSPSPSGDEAGPGSKDTVIRTKRRPGETGRPSTAPGVMRRDISTFGDGVGEGFGAANETPTKMRKVESIKKRRRPERGSLDLVLRLESGAAAAL